MARGPRLRKLAVSLVVTVAAPACANTSGQTSGACEPPDCHMNPPGVEPVPPTAAPEPTTAPTVAATSAPPVVTTVATATPPPTSAPTATAVVVENLPKAPAGAMVRRQGDRCYYQPPANCPPFDPANPRTCNPPGAQRVQCPAD